MTNPLQALVPQLAQRRVLVIGDLILDEYLTGNAARMSREAPVPVLEFESRRLIPGGAANPAANITALGSQALQVGVVGDDDSAEQLRAILSKRGIDASALITDRSRPTTVKTRIMAQMGLRFPQQVARLDQLSRQPVSAEIEGRIRDTVAQAINQADAVLFSDYHAGVLTASLVESIRELAGTTPVTADAQGELAKYAGCTLVKCNADEARAYLGRDLRSDDEFAAAAGELCRTLRLTGAMLITRGAKGVTLATADGAAYQVPAPAVSDVYDTVGAGDTTIAVLTLAIAAGATYLQGAALANAASGLVVRRVGNYAPSPAELVDALAG